ncbi:MAG: GlsB/YeaQ/YmgE family stress response membrane protein [Acidimicrobiia bacterium]
MLGFIIAMLIIGAIAGFLARLLVPGPDPMGIAMTIALGVVGSFVGGFIGWALFGKDLDEGALQPSGILGSIVGAIIVLLVYRAFNSRSVGGGTGRHLHH